MRATLLALALASSAWAEDKKVAVQAEVVLASKEAGQVDTALVPMQTALASRVKYLSLKSLRTVRLELTSAPTPLALANQKTAELSVVAIKDNVAQVKVKVPPVDATYSLGRDKSLYVQAGAHAGGDLWLVLSQPH